MKNVEFFIYFSSFTSYSFLVLLSRFKINFLIFLLSLSLSLSLTLLSSFDQKAWDIAAIATGRSKIEMNVMTSEEDVRRVREGVERGVVVGY